MKTQTTLILLHHLTENMPQLNVLTATHHIEAASMRVQWRRQYWMILIMMQIFILRRSTEHGLLCVKIPNDPPLHHPDRTDLRPPQTDETWIP